MRSRELIGITFAVRFPENNCTPQPIRFKHSTYIVVCSIILSNSLILVWHSTEVVALDFTPRPTLFFPLCLLLLSRLIIYWKDSFCTALQTRKLWIWSTGLSAQLIPSSQREVWVLGNLFVLTGRSRPDIRGMRGRGGKSCVWRLFPWRTLKISTFSAPW